MDNIPVGMADGRLLRNPNQSRPMTKPEQRGTTVMPRPRQQERGGSRDDRTCFVLLSRDIKLGNDSNLVVILQINK